MNVTLHTNHGDINLNLFPDHAPRRDWLRREGAKLHAVDFGAP